jgi:hypothetical protein
MSRRSCSISHCAAIRTTTDAAAAAAASSAANIAVALSPIERAFQTHARRVLLEYETHLRVRAIRGIRTLCFAIVYT